MVRDATGDDRLTSLLLEYVEAVERGERPDRQRLMESVPELAEQLAEFFATRDRVHRIAAPVRRLARSNPAIFLHPHAQEGASGEIGEIGDFRLLREIGRGGMGVVYEAEQVSLRRRVALKVLPFASALDPRHLQRFRNEAQAAAQLHHTNIVPVFAVGVERGVHYYAMQFIEGKSLAELITEMREARDAAAGSTLPQSPARPATEERSARKREDFRRIARLGKQAAEALAYAHQLGVLHRDIKPANLLLDDAGQLWITDFGLAQIRNDAGLTATGEVIGTALYMSPEQAAGERGVVDHRTDVYSLGATLYELLTLRPIFDAEDGRALLYQLANCEPKSLRGLDRSIPPELETIVLKTIAKSPTDRYASAQDLADDLQRFLDDRPILARRPTLLDRAAKWVRRHWALVSVSAALVLLLAIGLAISTALIAREKSIAEGAYLREREARDHERQRAEEAEARRVEAEQNYQRARRAINMFVELSDEELLDFLPLTGMRMRLLEAAITYYQELSDSRKDPQVQADLEASRARITKLNDQLAVLNEMSFLLLLEQPVVQADLGIAPESMAKLTPILERIRSYRPGPSAQHEPSKSLIAEQAASARKDVQKILTAAQYDRLSQIFRQIPGPHVFGHSTLDTLGLSEAQRVQVRRLRSEATHASLRLWSTAESRSASQPEFEDLWRRTNEKTAAIFTPTQRKRWAEMMGPPIESPVHFPLHSATRARSVAP